MASSTKEAIKDKGNKLEGEMSFFEHLEALRWHLIRASLAIVVFSIVTYAYYDEIFANVIMAPTHTDFWAYRMMCDMGKFFERLIPAWFSAKDFCVATGTICTAAPAGIWRCGSGTLL